MRRLSRFDFTELALYVERLAESGDADERERYADIVAEIVETLPPASLPLAQALVLECARCAAWGGDFEPVRDALARLVELNSGAAAAQQLQAEAREDAAEHGRRGGRPATGFDREWLVLFNARKARNPSVSDSETCRAIAANWTDAEGNSRRWRAIFDGVRRAQKKV